MARRSNLTDEEILARARTVFVERGYGARTQQIAAAVGLTWGAIALRFGDKRTLFTQAMGGPVCSPGDLEREQAGTEDLPGLLEQLRARLWVRWPLRLQYCLATAGQDPEPDELLDWLAAALEAQARRGSLRFDMSAKGFGTGRSRAARRRRGPTVHRARANIDERPGVHRRGRPPSVCQLTSTVRVWITMEWLHSDQAASSSHR